MEIESGHERDFNFFFLQEKEIDRINYTYEMLKPQVHKYLASVFVDTNVYSSLLILINYIVPHYSSNYDLKEPTLIRVNDLVFTVDETSNTPCKQSYMSQS